MKDADSGEHLRELDRPPRETRYEVQILMQTGEGLESFDAFVTDSPPAIPEAGESLALSWIENDAEEEVHDAVPESEISSDGDYTAIRSLSFEIVRTSTTYSKRTFERDDGSVDRVMTVGKNVVIDVPSDEP